MSTSMQIVFTMLAVLGAVFWILRLERKLRQSAKRNLELAKQLELKNSFLALASHEIRGPLGLVIGFADLVIEPELTPEQIREFARTIKRNGEQLSVLLNNVLDFSKLESGRIQTEVIHFSLEATLEEIVSSFQIKAREKGIRLELKCESLGTDDVSSDPARIKQILWNLISNAIKFTDNGYIRVSANYNGSRVVIDIEDTGIGLSEEQQKLIFKPFTQADETINRRFGGTGLGLALAQEIASVLGGSVQLKESSLGKGSVFRFEFPNQVDIHQASEARA